MKPTTNEPKTIRELLLSAPQSQLSKHARALVFRWSEPPKAVEVLEVLDKCVHFAWSSGFVVTMLELELNEAMRREGTTLEALENDAVWRDDLYLADWSDD